MKPLTYIVFVLFVINFVLFAFGATSQFTVSGFLDYANQYTGFNPDYQWKELFRFPAIRLSDFTISGDWGAFNFFKLVFELIVRSLGVFYSIGDFVISIFKALYYIYTFIMSLLSYFLSFI